MYYFRFNKLIIILMTSALEILPHHRREPKTRHICVVKTVVLFILFSKLAECWISVLRSKRIIKPGRASLKNNILKTLMQTNVCDFFLKTQHSLTYYSKAMCPSSVYYFSRRFFQSPGGGGARVPAGCQCINPLTKQRYESTVNGISQRANP
jgi:hypothetical protein